MNLKELVEEPEVEDLAPLVQRLVERMVYVSQGVKSKPDAHLGAVED